MCIIMIQYEIIATFRRISNMKEKVVLSLFRRTGYHRYHPVVKGAISIMMLSAAASTADRAMSWTDWKKEQNSPALPNYILKIS